MSSISKITDEPKTDFEYLLLAKLELNSLKKELSSIKIERGKDLSYIEELESENALLKKNFKDLESLDILSLKSELEELKRVKQENVNLLAGNKTLKKQNKLVREKNSELTAKNSKLIYELYQYKQTLEVNTNI